MNLTENQVQVQNRTNTSQFRVKRLLTVKLGSHLRSVSLAGSSDKFNGLVNLLVKMLKNATVRVCPCASLASGSVQLQTFTCRTLSTRWSSGLHFYFCLAATGLQVRSPWPFLCAARLFSPRVSRFSRYCFSLRPCSDLAACPGK